MMYKSFLLLATASTLGLAACAGSPEQIQTTNAAAPTVATTAPAGQPTSPASADLLNAPMNTPLSMMAPKSQTIETRLTRLETDVDIIKGQVQMVRPILEKMPALQDKLSELVTELERIDARVAGAKMNAHDLPAVTSDPGRVMPAPFKPAPKMNPIITPTPKPTASVVPQTPAAKSDPYVPEKRTKSLAMTPTTKGLVGVRVGDDIEKTRVVLDVAAPTEFQYDLDNAEKILIVDLNTPLTSAMMGEFDKSPLVVSYSTQSVTPEKSRLVLQLRAAVDVIKTSTLPSGDGKLDRIVFDLVPAS